MKTKNASPSRTPRAPTAYRALIGLAILALAIVVGVAALWARTPAAKAASASASRAPSQAPGPDESAVAAGPSDPSPPSPLLAPTVGDQEPTGELRLEGQVIDEAELPVEGAVVRLATTPPRVMRTAADGIFKFDRLVARNYQVVARKGTMAAGPMGALLTSTSGPLTLRMSRAPSVEVLVVDARARTPIPHATVQVDDVPDLVVGTDAWGVAHLDGVPAGLHLLRTSLRGYAPMSTSLKVSGSAGDAQKMEVRLAHGAPLGGRVVDAQGHPVAGARVQIESAYPQATLVAGFAEVARTDARGEFAFDAVGAGRQRITAQHEAQGTGASEPLDLDGTTPDQHFEVRLSLGAVLTGKVVTKTGARVAFATVRVASEDEGLGLHGGRQAQADEHGAFRVTGLGRGRVRAFAMHGAAISEALVVDTTRATEPISLVVDGDATIEGVVVLPSGEPASDVEVAAVAARSGDEDKRTGHLAVQDPMLTGFAHATTDSAGRFTLQGLRAGAYRVRAGRAPTTSSSFWLRRGVVATSGTRDVRIVLESDSVVKGRLVYADGTAPHDFVVALTMSPPTPFFGETGAFSLEHVPAGKQAVSISGPDVAPTFLDDIDVAPGQEVDLGVVRVARPRTLSGRVTRPDGAPVAGATVHAGGMLVGSGDKVSVAANADDTHEVVSGADGRFVLKGLAKVPLVVIADSPRDGRSKATPVAADADAPSLELVVQPTGVLQGTVTRAGRPVPHAYVVATTREANRARTVVETDEAGAYRFDALAPDTYSISAAVSEGFAVSTKRTAIVHVTSGSTVVRDLSVPGGDVGLTVSVVERSSQKHVPNGLAYLVTGDVHSTRYGELETEMINVGEGKSFMAPMAKGGPASFEAVEPGSYSFCVVGIFADLDEPAVVQRLQRQAARLPVACVPLDVPPTPAHQERTVTVP